MPSLLKKLPPLWRVEKFLRSNSPAKTWHQPPPLFLDLKRKSRALIRPILYPPILDNICYAQYSSRSTAKTAPLSAYTLNLYHRRL